MKIYLPNAKDKAQHNVFVQPGNHHPVSEWMDESGKAKLLTVCFRFGCAEVPDNLGQYMLDNELAHSSPIIVIERIAA